MKTHHILSLALWVAAPLTTATEIPPIPTRIELKRTTAFDWNSFFALHEACIEGKHEQARKLIAEGADKNVALFCACASGGRCTELIKELLASGADVNAASVAHCTPLYAAIGSKRLGECEGWAARAAAVTPYTGQSEVVQLLLETGANPDTCSSGDRVPPIIEAARTGDTATVELLLNAGADVNAREISGNSALHWAVAKNHNHIVELLLQRGAHPAIPSINRDYFDKAGVCDNMPGTTPLHCAARCGNAKAAELLIQHGADIHAEDSLHATPFICTAESASVEVLKLLHKNGANICNPAVINRLNLYRETVVDYLQYLAKAGFPFEQTNIFSIACHHPKAKEILTLLKKHGYKAPAANEMGESALYFLLLYANRHAKQEDIIAVIDLLVDCGADVPSMGFLALSHCVDNGYDRVFFRLLELGAPLTSPQPKQKRLLTACASYPRSVEGRKRIMQWLEQQHPDLVAAEQAELKRREAAEARSKLNKQLIQEAQRGNISAVQELLAKGADLNYTNNFNDTALSATYGMTPNLLMSEFLLQQSIIKLNSAIFFSL